MMPSLRFGLMSLLLLAAIWRFTRGGPWMWAPLLVSSSLVALADAYGPDETTDLSTTATRALNLWLLLTLPLLAAMHTVLWWMAGTGDAFGLGSALLRLGGPDLAAARLASGPWSWLGAVLRCIAPASPSTSSGAAGCSA